MIALSNFNRGALVTRYIIVYVVQEFTVFIKIDFKRAFNCSGEIHTAQHS